MPQQQDSESCLLTREHNLSSYASHLQQLSSHLEIRAKEIQSSEERLAASQSHLSAHRHALTQLETRTRYQIAQLLHHIHHRQTALVSWERKAALAKKSLLNKVESVDALLSEYNHVASRLPRLKNDCETVQLALSEHQTKLAQVQAQLEAASSARDTLDIQLQAIAKDKQIVQRAINRLQALDATLKSRQTDLDARERDLDEKHSRLERLQSFERLTVPLQSFIDQAAAASIIAPISIDTDISAAVVAAVVALGHCHTLLQEVQAARKEITNSRKQIVTRETNVRNAESDLRIKREALDRENSALRERMFEVSTTQSEVGDAWKAIEDARKETDARDESMRARGLTAEHTESRLQHHEAALSERERGISTRERSIRRAHAAVTARERAFENKEQEIETERVRLKDLRKAIDLRADILDTRELELSTSENDHSRQTNGALHRSHEHRRSADNNRADDNSRMIIKTRGSRASDAGRCPRSIASPTDDMKTAPTSTVRRQLAFFEAGKDANVKHTGESAAEQSIADEQSLPDTESEEAAEQLLPELVGARSYWLERVERLERIVRGMRDKISATKPHLQPVLITVGEGLQAIRREIEDSPGPSGNASQKGAYLSEQASQLRWREQMRQHFDTVREIQAGLLISLNREEDNAGDAQEHEHGPSGRSASSVAEESSVEATLDATLTGDMAQEAVRIRGHERVEIPPSLHLPQHRHSSFATANESESEISADGWNHAADRLRSTNRLLLANEPQPDRVDPREERQEYPARGDQIHRDMTDPAVMNFEPMELSSVNADLDSEQVRGVSEGVSQELEQLRDELQNVTTT